MLLVKSGHSIELVAPDRKGPVGWDLAERELNPVHSDARSSFTASGSHSS